MSFCTNCGAPVRQLVAGRCPHCQMIIDNVQASGVVIDGRGPIWRVVVFNAGPKPKKTAKALATARGWDSAQATSFLSSIAPNTPRILVENIGGREALEIFMALQMESAEVSLERRQGSEWIVTNSSQIIRDFAARQKK